jgi:protoheme IX farnesyltransferase
MDRRSISTPEHTAGQLATRRAKIHYDSRPIVTNARVAFVVFSACSRRDCAPRFHCLARCIPVGFADRSAPDSGVASWSARSTSQRYRGTASMGRHEDENVRTLLSAAAPTARWHRRLGEASVYLELTKPRVVALIVFTAVVGMFLATPDAVPLRVLLLGSAGIWLAAASAAAFNHVLDRRADALMARTRARPLPRHQLSSRQAVVFATALALLAAPTLALGVNVLTAALTLLALVGYSVVYTVWLKPLTPQNIVLGGAAGAAPPVLGWTAVTGEVAADALLLFMLVFVWTPPHFWSLALYRQTEYARAGIPMLPVTHGSAFTRRSILLYTLLLSAVTLLPFASGMSGPLYLAGALVLDARFVALAWRLDREYSDALARKTFGYSILYLAALFALLLVDHYGAGLESALRSLLVAPPA